MKIVYLKLSLFLALIASPALAQSPNIYAADGTYLGSLNANRWDPNSTSNPYGRYGCPYSGTSINNPYSQYGSRYGSQSPNNPYSSSNIYGFHRFR